MCPLEATADGRLPAKIGFKLALAQIWHLFRFSKTVVGQKREYNKKNLYNAQDREVLEFDLSSGIIHAFFVAITALRFFH